MGGIILLRGFYTAASGMIAQQRNTETISNNISNANTPGYKADQATLRSFPELLIQQMGKVNVPTTNGLNLQQRQPLGGLVTGVYAQESISNFSQGPIRETGLLTDLALVDGALPEETGGLFFTVEDDNGEERYTRNGHFTVDGEGFLTTGFGNYVLDDNKNRIQTGGMNFQVTDDGDVQIGPVNTPLHIAYVEDTNDLIKDDNDMYMLEAGQAANAANTGAAYEIHQGVLEGSNVDAMQAMTDMMTSYRSFEQNQRVLKAYDESMGKAVSEIARLR